MSRPWLRPLLLLLGVVLGVNLLAVVVGRYAPEPSGPPGSSLATAPEGLAAYAELLRRHGHPAGALREPLAEATMDPRQDTVVVTAPDRLTREDVGALRRFVERGGRLVMAGRARDQVIGGLVERPPRFAPEPSGPARTLAPVAETAGVREARADAEGVWADAGGTLPALGRPGSFVLVVGNVGRGTVALLSQSAPLSNRSLPAADNAALALGLAGGAGRRVRFAESVHGFGRETGLAAVPGRWRWALAGLALAGLVLMASRARRLGPPESRSRDLPPARSEYALSLAAVLERTGRRAEAVAPARERARTLLARRAGLGPDPGDEELARAARRLAMPDEEAAALSGRPHDDAGVLATGRALARLSGGGERR